MYVFLVLLKVNIKELVAEFVSNVALRGRSCSSRYLDKQDVRRVHVDIHRLIDFPPCFRTNCVYFVYIFKKHLYFTLSKAF